MSSQGLTWLDCLCACNPFWCDDSTEYLDILENNDHYLFQEGELDNNKTSTSFLLDRDYNPLGEYYKIFDTLDTLNSGKSEMTQSQFQSIRDRLFSNDGLEYTALHSDLILYRLYIRSLPHGEEKIDSIKEYEYYRGEYNSFILGTDEQSAKLYLKNARTKSNNGDIRLFDYQRAIYFTHLTKEKNAIRMEYVNFCDSIRNK